MTKDDTISAYRDFTEWCKENPSFDLDVRLHTHSGRIGDGGYISDETTRIAFAAWRAAIKADRQRRSEPLSALAALVNALRERHYGRMPDDVQAAYDRAWSIVYASPQPTAPKFGEEK